MSSTVKWKNCEQLKSHSAAGSVLVTPLAGADPSPVVLESPFPYRRSHRIEVWKSPSPQGGLASEYGVVTLDLIFSTALFHCHD